VFQIDEEIDTINFEIDKRHDNLRNQFSNYFLVRTMHTAGLDQPHQSVKQFYKKLSKNDLSRCVENAQNLVRSSCGYIDSINDEIRGHSIRKTDFSMGWHKKINVPFACIVLFFVGAPLGAIIRKGGMGLPVVVAVIFFLLYYVVTIVYEDLVMEGVYTVGFGTWFPLVLFLPLGIFLTYKAAKDSSIFDVSLYIQPLKKLFARKK